MVAPPPSPPPVAGWELGRPAGVVAGAPPSGCRTVPPVPPATGAEASGPGRSEAPGVGEPTPGARLVPELGEASVAEGPGVVSTCSAGFAS
ncbi:hypothetical protein [Streptomyces lusitanus]|uniref:hypothetical protein n=1 Tax=Streptomyces lusitanus TaxID=68232 RepID=UPI0021C178C1|nr:hypothetical protein [Streptomyces lusitanus]